MKTLILFYAILGTTLQAATGLPFISRLPTEFAGVPVYKSVKRLKNRWSKRK